MIAVVLLVIGYALVSLIAIVYLLRRCAKIQETNLRLLAKSVSLALFLTPTISVPATIPIPAVLQLCIGILAVHPGLALVGLLPIVVATIACFLLLKATKLLRKLVYDEPSD
ncbi:MAG: hypothetical protein CME44_03575 [Haliea sp.]|jgi:hypothetical protein|nr:hypothetical protein [Haliea sp.]MBK40260.1 hypothetical protein [Haliea sp.]MBP68847.1 hypothetical protein [Haliea sp.]